MILAIGSDHGGYELKEEIKKHLEKRGIEFKDFGCYSPESVDYPIIAKQVGEAVASGEYERGLLFCGTGALLSPTSVQQGESIPAVCHAVSIISGEAL